MKSATVTLRNPADGVTFTRTYKIPGKVTSHKIKVMALRDHPRCIILKMVIKT